MGFKDQVATDLRANVFNADEFAETITYTPKGGVAKSIKAVVTRNPIRMLGNGVQEMPAHTIQVRIQRDATYGVLTVKTEHDLITLPLHVGGTPEDFVVGRIVKENAFMFLVECYRG